MQNLNKENLNILGVFAKLILPFIVAFSLYIQVSGDSAPGGGFQAGAVLSAVLVLVDIIFGSEVIFAYFSIRKLIIYASAGVIIYLLPGLISLFSQKGFLNYFALDFLSTEPQKAGIVLIEFGVGMTVFSSLSIIYLKFINLLRNEKS